MKIIIRIRRGGFIKIIERFLKSHIIIIVIIMIMNGVLIIVAYESELILQEEIYQKNIERGISKCAEAVNSLDNIIYLGENIVNFVKRDFSYLSKNENIQNLDKKFLNETFAMINDHSDYFLNLYIACEEKVISSRNEIYESSNPVGRVWYDLALIRGDMVITNPYKDLHTGEYVITISKKLENKNCVVGLDVAQTKLFNVLKKETVNDQSIIYGFVINRDGIIVASTDGKNLGLSAIDESIDHAENIKPYFDELLKSDSGQIVYGKGDDVYTLVHQRTASDWHVIYSVNKNIMNKENNFLRNQIRITYIICFVLLNIIVLVYYFKRIKAMRLKDRAEKAEQDLLRYKDNLENLVLEKTEDIRVKGERLKELNTAIIDNLADIVEFRDLESGQHIKRMKIYTYYLAKKMSELYPEYQLCKEDIDFIYQASALHDIGKIGISDSILLKPGKLTKEEYEEMKKHTIIGDEIASRVLAKYDPRLAKYGHEICRYHHERYDGKGYPEGLLGEEIPICAHIVALADVYDALTEKRVYKDAFSHETALQMIRNGECGIFSEKLMRCLELLQDDFELISKQYKEEI